MSGLRRIVSGKIAQSKVKGGGLVSALKAMNSSSMAKKKMPMKKGVGC